MATGYRSRPALRLLAGTVSLPLVLAGCSGGSTDEAAPSASPSASESSASASSSPEPSPTPPPTPEPTAPEKPEGLKNTKAGRAEFSQYVIDAWVYAFVSNAVKPLTSVSVKGGCGGCGALSKEMDRRAKQGWHVELYGVGVGTVEEPKKQPEGRTTITETTIAIPESPILNDDGSLRATSPAHPDAQFTSKITYQPPKKKTTGKGKKKKTVKTPGHFQLESFGVATNDKGGKKNGTNN